jgi:hypothetical protein
MIGMTPAAQVGLGLSLGGSYGGSTSSGLYGGFNGTINDLVKKVLELAGVTDIPPMPDFASMSPSDLASLADQVKSLASSDLVRSKAEELATQALSTALAQLSALKGGF